MQLSKKVTRLEIGAEPENQTVYVAQPVARHSMEGQMTQQEELMRVIAKIFKEAMYEMSEIERRTSYLAGVTATVRDHHARLAQARDASPAEQAAQQERFENYLRRLGQLAELGNRALILEAAKATEAISGRTLGSAGSQLDEVVRPGLPPSRR